jgi:hypothetical protein
MKNSELLDNLYREVESVSAPKQAHVHIQRIFDAYKKEVERLEEEAKKESKK